MGNLLSRHRRGNALKERNRDRTVKKKHDHQSKLLIQPNNPPIVTAEQIVSATRPQHRDMTSSLSPQRLKRIKNSKNRTENNAYAIDVADEEIRSIDQTKNYSTYTSKSKERTTTSICCASNKPAGESPRLLSKEPINLEVMNPRKLHTMTKNKKEYDDVTLQRTKSQTPSTSRFRKLFFGKNRKEPNIIVETDKSQTVKHRTSPTKLDEFLMKDEIEKVSVRTSINRPPKPQRKHLEEKHQKEENEIIIKTTRSSISTASTFDIFEKDEYGLLEIPMVDVNNGVKINIKMNGSPFEEKRKRDHKKKDKTKIRLSEESMDRMLLPQMNHSTTFQPLKFAHRHFNYPFVVNPDTSNLLDNSYSYNYFLAHFPFDGKSHNHQQNLSNSAFAYYYVPEATELHLLAKPFPIYKTNKLPVGHYHYGIVDPNMMLLENDVTQIQGYTLPYTNPRYIKSQSTVENVSHIPLIEQGSFQPDSKSYTIPTKIDEKNLQSSTPKIITDEDNSLQPSPQIIRNIERHRPSTQPSNQQSLNISECSPRNQKPSLQTLSSPDENMFYTSEPMVRNVYDEKKMQSYSAIDAQYDSSPYGGSLFTNRNSLDDVIMKGDLFDKPKKNEPTTKRPRKIYDPKTAEKDEKSQSAPIDLHPLNDIPTTDSSESITFESEKFQPDRTRAVVPDRELVAPQIHGDDVQSEKAEELDHNKDNLNLEIDEDLQITENYPNDEEHKINIQPIKPDSILSAEYAEIKSLNNGNQQPQKQTDENSIPYYEVCGQEKRFASKLNNFSDVESEGSSEDSNSIIHKTIETFLSKKPDDDKDKSYPHPISQFSDNIDLSDSDEIIHYDAEHILNISVPKLDIEPPSFELEKPGIDISSSKLDVELKTPDIDISVPKLDIETPSFELKKPDIDISLPKLDVETPSFELEKPDIDISLPKMDIEGPSFELKKPDIDISVPKLDIEGPSFELEKPDIDIETPSFELKKPDIDISGPKLDIEGSSFELKKPEIDISVPKLDIEGPSFELKKPDIDIERPSFELEKPDIDISVPKLDVETPSFELKKPDIDIEGPSFELEKPEIDISVPKLDIEGPSFELEKPDIDISVPKLDVEAPSFELQKPDIDIEAPSFELEKPDIDISVPKLDIEGPSFELEKPDIDISVPKWDVEAPSSELGKPDIDIEGPSFELEKPGIDISVPKLDIEGPSFELGKPDIDIERPSFELEKPGIDISVPKLDIETPSFELKKPDFDISVPKLDIEAPSFELKKPDFEISVPKLDIKGPSSELEKPHFDISAPKLDIEAPVFELEKPDVAVEVISFEIEKPYMDISETKLVTEAQSIKEMKTESFQTKLSSPFNSTKVSKDNLQFFDTSDGQGEAIETNAEIFYDTDLPEKYDDKDDDNFLLTELIDVIDERYDRTSNSNSLLSSNTDYMDTLENLDNKLDEVELFHLKQKNKLDNMNSSLGDQAKEDVNLIFDNSIDIYANRISAIIKQQEDLPDSDSNSLLSDTTKQSPWWRKKNESYDSINEFENYENIAKNDIGTCKSDKSRKVRFSQDNPTVYPFVVEEVPALTLQQSYSGDELTDIGDDLPSDIYDKSSPSSSLSSVKTRDISDDESFTSASSEIVATDPFEVLQDSMEVQLSQDGEKFKCSGSIFSEDTNKPMESISEGSFTTVTKNDSEFPVLGDEDKMKGKDDKLDVLLNKTPELQLLSMLDKGVSPSTLVEKRIKNEMEHQLENVRERPFSSFPLMEEKEISTTQFKEENNNDDISQPFNIHNQRFSLPPFKLDDIYEPKFVLSSSYGLYGNHFTTPVSPVEQLSFEETISTETSSPTIMSNRSSITTSSFDSTDKTMEDDDVKPKEKKKKKEKAEKPTEQDKKKYRRRNKLAENRHRVFTHGSRRNSKKTLDELREMAKQSSSSSSSTKSSNITDDKGVYTKIFGKREKRESS
ncbi:hypothetical protein SNEBB_010536 [Seison nebaliae]|nr:hypothetical protein SNEBB_010536 [Seison nebaliae]